ncbi:MAG: hypothetical protein M0Z94_05170 [Dehalococcoidales bacterium]|nr:hypothetical protein [Dehalococcoidales bacterium]
MKQVELQRCARTVIACCVCLQPGERVLVVTDTMRDQSVAQTLVGEALAWGNEAVLAVIPTRRLSPQEPPASVLAAMQKADVVFLYTTDARVWWCLRLAHRSTPVRMVFEGGRLAKIKGGAEAARLEHLLASLDDPNAYAFAAWGIGCNPGAPLEGQGCI